MDEFHRNVLGIRGIRSASKRQKPPATQKSLGHSAAGLCKAPRLMSKKRFLHLIARQ
jgi:hypothetical protein